MDRKRFFNEVRASLYGAALNQAQVDGMDAILDAWERYGDDDPRKLAYLLGTAHHETGAFRWMREVWGPTAAQSRYEGRADLGNVVAGDGRKFAGRGFVQLTGRANYADWSRRMGLDLIKEPDLVLEPEVAARILVQGSLLGTFTGKKLGDYATFRDMRRVINGTDKAETIATFAERFLAAIRAADFGMALPPEPDIDHYPEPPRQPDDPGLPPPRPKPPAEPAPNPGMVGLGKAFLILLAVVAIGAAIFLFTR